MSPTACTGTETRSITFVSTTIASQWFGSRSLCAALSAEFGTPSRPPARAHYLPLTHSHARTTPSARVCSGNKKFVQSNKGPWYLPWGGHRYKNPCYYAGTKVVNCKTGSNQIRFTSDIDQAISDESWAFRSV